MKSGLSRHEKILEIINVGKTPVLPFEPMIAEATHESLIQEQRELGQLLGEAMNQSAETWDDNGPADAVVHTSRILVGRAKHAMSIIRNSVIVSYPDIGEHVATLGSVVRIHYLGSTEGEDIFITGATSKLPKEIEIAIGAPDQPEISAATIRSPFVQSLLGRTVGETVTLNPTGRKILSYVIDGLRQFNPTQEKLPKA